jgi:2,4-dienoyl-CoA reductase-like NADH-dependent reductase (Old Yellow Enzyme family)
MSLGVPVIAVNQLDQVERALETLNEGRASLVAIGRGLIADPEWAIKVREGRLDEIVGCIYCDACHEDLRAGRPVGCSQW